MKLLLFAPDRYLLGMAIWLISGAVGLWWLLRFRRFARDLPGRTRVMNAPYVSEGLTVSRFDAHPNERAYEPAAEAIRGRLLDNFTRTKE